MILDRYEQEEFDSRYYAYKNGYYTTLAEAFPLLTPKALTFLADGTLPEEWNDNGYNN